MYNYDDVINHLNEFIGMSLKNIKEQEQDGTIWDTIDEYFIQEVSEDYEYSDEYKLK